MTTFRIPFELYICRKSFFSLQLSRLLELFEPHKAISIQPEDLSGHSWSLMTKDSVLPITQKVWTFPLLSEYWALCSRLISLEVLFWVRVRVSFTLREKKCFVTGFLDWHTNKNKWKPLHFWVQLILSFSERPIEIKKVSADTEYSAEYLPINGPKGVQFLVK